MVPFFLIFIIWIPLALSLPTPPYSLSPLGWFYIPVPNTTSHHLPPSIKPRSLPSSGHITLNDYPSLSTIALNPPYCGFAYNYPRLDLARVTAMETATTADCGTCLRVCGAAGCKEVLVIDKGGRGLDLSTGARTAVLGEGQDIGWAEWGAVDSSFCEGVVRGGGVGGREEEEEEVQAHVEELTAGVVETVFSVSSVPASTSISTLAPEHTEALVPLSTAAGSTLALESTSDGPATLSAAPTDEAAFLSALAGPSPTHTSAVLSAPNATDEEGFLSVLATETHPPSTTVSSASSSSVMTTVAPTSSTMSAVSNALSPPPQAASTTSSPSTAVASPSVSPAISSVASTFSLASSATAVLIMSTNSSAPSSALLSSSPPTYTSPSNASAHGGVLHPIVSSGAARQALPLQRSGSLAVLVPMLLAVIVDKYGGE
ncbi:hypothetical protein MMC11_004659 [Xylographa trunciseda]|nr:hypothetical protein [Xylographa trunciseda]